MIFGVTDRGFVVKDYGSILADLQVCARKHLGQDVDLDDHSPLGQIFATIAYAFAQQWQLLEAVYYAAYVDTAQAASLNHSVAALGIERNPATRAGGMVTFSRTVAGRSITIPASIKVSTLDGTTYSTVEQAILPADALSVEIEVLADLPGAAGNVGEGRIRSIVSPVAGIETVANAAAMAGGADTETDSALRYRAIHYVPGSKATLDAIELALLAIPGVISVRATEDTTENTILATVVGGPDEQVADVLDEYRPAGIAASYVRPSVRLINVTVLVRAAAGHNPSDVQLAIGRALSTYLTGLGLKKDVEFSDLAEAVLGVTGVDTITSLSATDGTNTINGFGQSLQIGVVETTGNGTHTITVNP